MSWSTSASTAVPKDDFEKLLSFFIPICNFFELKAPAMSEVIQPSPRPVLGEITLPCQLMKYQANHWLRSYLRLAWIEILPFQLMKYQADHWLY